MNGNDYTESAVDYYKEILVELDIHKTFYLETLERNVLAFFLLFKVALDGSDETGRTNVCNEQSDFKLFMIKLGKRRAKDLYTLIKFFENKLATNFSQDFGEIGH